MKADATQLDNVNVEYYNHAFADYFDKVPFEDVLPNLFLSNVPKHPSEILEIGSGAGALALWMTEQGHNVTCVEPAEVPAEKARQSGLKVHQLRFQDYQTDQKFDSVVAISSLIHIPLSEMSEQIKRIADFLNPDGMAMFSFIEGQGEGFEDPTEKGRQRFFSKFSEHELNDLLQPYFSLIEMKRIKVEVMKQFFLLLVLKKKEIS